MKTVKISKFENSYLIEENEYQIADEQMDRINAFFKRADELKKIAIEELDIYLEKRKREIKP